MAIYRKVDRDINTDEKYLALSDPPPCGKFLWLNLLMGKHTILIPGVIPARSSEVSASLGWCESPATLAGARDAWGEVIGRGMAVVDDHVGLIWLPNALRRNMPQSPNHIRQWAAAWSQLPPCPLLSRIWQSFHDHLQAHRKSWGKAFKEACPEPSAQPLPESLPESFITVSPQSVDRIPTQIQPQIPVAVELDSKVPPQSSPPKQCNSVAVLPPPAEGGAAHPVEGDRQQTLLEPDVTPGDGEDDPFAPYQPDLHEEPTTTERAAEAAAALVDQVLAPEEVVRSLPEGGGPGRAVAAAPEPPEPGDPSPHQAFIDVFHREFEKHRGVPPTWGAKEGKLVKTVLQRTNGDLVLALKRVKRMFEMAPRFPAENPDLATLVGHWDKFAPPVKGGVGAQAASAAQVYADGEVKL